jgi:nuclear cap-binding protein subunit 2
MSALYHTEETPQLICWDRNYYTNFEDQLNALKQTRTIYVGNLSFFTREEQLLETFSVVGPVKRVIMGLNSVSKTPCGFCFIEYYNQEHYKAALKYISGRCVILGIYNTTSHNLANLLRGLD